MPQTARGQLISFAIEKDADQRFVKWKRINVKAGQSVASIAAHYGNPEDTSDIVKKNNVRSGANYVLKTKKPKKKHGESKKAFNKRVTKWKKRQTDQLWVPGNFSSEDSLNVLAGDTPPSIGKGYAKFSSVDRPERVGLVRFEGYDPTEMRVPIRFESESVGSGGTKEARHDGGQSIEDDCALLERLAGRGQFRGSAVGPPPIITVSTTSGGRRSEQNPLIPMAYQVSESNQSGPRWRVVDIEWDDTTALRNKYGHRIRQLATVVLWEHVGLTLNSRSSTRRAKSRPKPKAKPKKTGARTKKGPVKK